MNNASLGKSGVAPAAIPILALLMAGWLLPLSVPAQERGRPAALPEEIAPPVARAAPADRTQLLQGPLIRTNPEPPSIQAAEPTQTDQPLPINLATALYLSDARPLIIAHAVASVQQAAAQLQGANVLWLPNFNLGADYFHHDGVDQTTTGDMIHGSLSSLGAGGGVTLDLDVSEAIFRPLVARQVLAARQCDLQAARNNALQSVALAYFDVQQSRGRLAGVLDASQKAGELTKEVQGLAKDLVPPMEVDRVLSLAADLNQQVASARTDWRVTSARLNRVLRLNPASVVVPLEPPHLQVTLISQGCAVDDLIAVGLLSRPELSSRRALVEVTLERLRQERLRPLIPSVLLQGQGPYGAFNGAVFGGGRNDDLSNFGGRFDAELGLVWTLENFGLGNRARVRQRSAEQAQALIDFFDIQDRVAQEVAEAYARVDASGTIVAEAEIGVKESLATFRGTLEGLRETRTVGNLRILISRPQEAVAALQQLNRAYNAYYAAIGDYNRAQFQLYHALGFPARIVAADRPAGQVQPVDFRRPPQMDPVCPQWVYRTR